MVGINQSPKEIFPRCLRITLSVLVLLTLVSSNAVAQSLSPDEQKSIYGDTVWYKPSAAGTACLSPNPADCDGINPPDPGDVSGNQALGKQLAADTYGWTGPEWACLYTLWKHESGWSETALNDNNGNGQMDPGPVNGVSDAYGIPQSLPPNKMAAFGEDWVTNPATQIKWGLNYISGRYNTPCSAWQLWLSRYPHWY